MTARELALLELDAMSLPGWPARELAAVNPSKEPDPRDRALADRIVALTVKNLFLLQHLTIHYSSRKLVQIDPLVQKILTIALAQLRFLDRVPASAVVDEAVKQTRRFSRKSAAGFVNAVLRNATRDPNPPLPSPEGDPAEYARIVLSHPAELYSRLANHYGSDYALAICRHDNSEPPTLVRLFRGAHLDLPPHQQPGIYVTEGLRRDVLAEWAETGVAQVQDATAATVVPHLDVQPGQRILDRCCGLGTKTLQIRDELGDQGFIVAVDPSGPRCEVLRRLLGIRRITNVQVLQTPMISPLNLPPFDRILIDVPCSNSGVLARRAEARYTQSPSRLSSLARLQDEILADTANHLIPGGLLLYSTCSLWPEENDQRTSTFLNAHPDYALIDSALTLPAGADDPTAYCDGGYWALLKRQTSR